MRKYKLFTIVFAMLATVACSQVDQDIDYLGVNAISMIDASIDDPATRTYALVGADGTVQMLWASEDKIMITDGSVSSVFTLKSGVATKQATFSGSISTNQKSLAAVYPASSAKVEGSQVKVVIPTVQSYVAKSDVSVGGRNLMLGSTNNGSDFSFYTVGALARFSIKVEDSETIHSVSMRVEDGYLAGEGLADFHNLALGDLSSREVMLSYAEPAMGATSDGWALIAPLDFTALKGNVYYDVVTSKGCYTFCRKPTKRFLSGYIYNFPLSVDKFTKVNSESELADGKYIFKSNDSSLTVQMVRATDTTIAVGWSAYGFPEDASQDKADTYELYLYDAQDNLLLAWCPNNNQCSESGKKIYSNSAYFKTRFIFSGLTPDTVYKVLVKNITDNVTSNLLTVSTPPTDCDKIVTLAKNEGDVILFENFGKLVWNGDLSTFSAGYEATDATSVYDVKDGTAWGDYRSTSQTDFKYSVCTRERNLFTTYPLVSFTQSLGLGDWCYWRNSADDAASSTSSTILMRPGYLKLGASNIRAGIVTAPLTPLLGKATVRVSFKAMTYGTTSVSDFLDISIKSLDNVVVNDKWRVSSSTTLSEAKLTLKSELKWNDYMVELSGVTPSSRIVIAGDAADVSSKNNRFFLDDVKVEFVKYDDESVNTAVPVVEQVAASTSSVTVEWTKTSGSAYTVMVYGDAACSELLQSRAFNVGHASYFGTWPARYTIPALSANRAYYVTVKDGSGAISRPITVRTQDAGQKASNAILSADFDLTCMGGDYMNQAYSVKIANNSSADNLSEAMSSVTVVLPSADGSSLSACSTNVVSLFGMEGWESVNAYPRQGYFKLGTASAAGSLMTPALTNIMENNVQVEVSFKVCPFVSSATAPQADYMYVRLIDGVTGAEKQSQRVSIPGFKNVPGWDDYSVAFEGVNATDKIQFASGADSQSCFCLDDVLITSDATIMSGDICGYVTDSTGAPISDVVVSDGFTAVKTSGNGFYSMSVHDDCWYIYISIPADCEVPINGYGQPAFFVKYKENTKRYDFTLTKMAGGAEKKFSLFCLADPQCKDATHRGRFLNESAPDIKAHAQSKGVPCYGVTLGDVSYSEGSRNCVAQMPYLRDHMAKSVIGMPIFQTMGNHDYTYFKSGQELLPDEGSSTAQIRAQRAFEDVFGPINYSWNRGDVHIVCMRNMLWNTFTDASNYKCGFSSEQYEWLKQDLSHVSKDKMVILCVHIPLVIYNSSSYPNVSNVINLLKKFKEGHIMSGHTHYMRNEPTTLGVFEHVHAAVCGAWWYSNVNGDGCPNGYGVYDIDGATITNSYYKGVNTGMNDRDYQIRLYRGNMRCGGKYDYIQLQHGSNVILANVFNADKGWKVKVYENDVYSGDMTMIPNYRETEPAIGTSEANPCKPSTSSSQDWWAIGYHTGIIGRGNSAVGGKRTSYTTNLYYHMYKYTLKNPSAKVRVEATDRWGRTYSASTFTADYDYSVMNTR